VAQTTVTVKTDAMLALLTKALAKSCPTQPVVIAYNPNTGTYSISAVDMAFQTRRVKEILGGRSR